MKPLSQQLLSRKQEKLRLSARQVLEANGGVDGMFRNFRNRPTQGKFTDMVIAGRFGPSDPLSPGGDWFAFEYVLDEVNRWVSVVRGSPEVMEHHASSESHSIIGISSQSELYGNLLFLMEMDATLFEHWGSGPIIEDFDLWTAPNGNVHGLVEKASRSFGLRIEATPMMPLSDAVRMYEGMHRSYMGSPCRPEWIPSDFKANDLCTFYFVDVAPMERLQHALPMYDRLCGTDDRGQHEVTGHDRRLGSGKTVPVRPHERRNPTRLGGRRINTADIDFLVYRARDADGVVRYVGEGTRRRPEHINSGISHNFKINEHYFTRGPMTVKIIAEHLSKEEAQAVEILILRSHRGSMLWNIKDYEPDIHDFGDHP